MSFISRALVIALGFGLLVSAQSNFPPVAVWETGQFHATPVAGLPDVFCKFTNGGFVQYQNNADPCARNAEGIELWSAADNDGGLGTNGLRPPQACGDNNCNLVFGLDGNLVSTFGSEVMWTSGTEGRGMWLVCQETAPWLYIVNGAGETIWSTAST